MMCLSGIIAWTQCDPGGKESLKLIRKAQKLAQKGDCLDAGDLYQTAGENDKALDMYMKVRAYNRSAPLLERLGRLKEAARHYAKSGQFSKAAEVFAGIKEYYDAGLMYRQDNYPHLAAEMFHKAKAYSDAAIMFEQARDHKMAGKLYLDRGIYRKAILCFERVLKNALYDGQVTPSGMPVLKEIGIACASAYEKLKDYRTAAKYYFKAGAVSEAARVCRLFGDLKSAAKYLELAGLDKEASQIYEELGEMKKAKQLLIQNLLKEDRFSEAANLADGSGEFKIAAEAYEKAGDLDKAGEMFYLTNQPDKAAEIFLKSKNWARAVFLFEQIGNLEKAAELREQMGELDKAAELYAQVDKPVKSAELYIESGWLDEAIRVLQNTWSQGNRQPVIRNLLGLAFLRRGNFELAYDNYLKFLLEEKVTRGNQSILYELGTGFEKRGQIEQALKLFERLSAHNLDYKDIKQRVANCFQKVSINKGLHGTSHHQFTPGRMVADRYVIKEKVGAGGMGIVYRSVDEELGIEVALKVLKPKYSNDSEMVSRFKREVTLAREIRHENVVQIYGFDKIINLLYIFMEYFPSRDLKALIRARGVLETEEIVHIMTQACRGLWAAHQRGIVHRDIKPQNILLNDDGVVKLVDFGIAIVMETSKESNSEFVVGTPDYMSPEQAKGEVTDTRSDIYSLGTILYETATGAPPFSNRDSFQTLMDQVERNPEPPIDINKNIPVWLNDLILRCLDKNPVNRYDSVQEIERQLATCGIADLMLGADSESEEDDEF